jgi:hypothetical protein
LGFATISVLSEVYDPSITSMEKGKDLAGFPGGILPREKSQLDLATGVDLFVSTLIAP